MIDANDDVAVNDTNYRIIFVTFVQFNLNERSQMQWHEEAHAKKKKLKNKIFGMKT